MLAFHHRHTGHREFDDGAELHTIGIFLPREAGFHQPVQHGDDPLDRVRFQQSKYRQLIEGPSLRFFIFRPGQHFGDDPDTKFPPQPCHRREQLPHEQDDGIGDRFAGGRFLRQRFLATAADVAAAVGNLLLIAKIIEDLLPPTTVDLCVADHQIELLLRMILPLGDDPGIGAGRVFADFVDEKFLRVAILIAEQNHAARRPSIPPRTAGLLIIRLQRPRQIIVKHKADIRLVNPHAKGVGRHRDGAGRAHELFLVGGSRGRIHAGVIRENGAVFQIRREQ